MFKKFPELIENAETISYIGKIENIVGCVWNLPEAGQVSEISP